MSRQTLTNARITDEDVASEIMESLAWDTRIHYPHIRVTVEGGSPTSPAWLRFATKSPYSGETAAHGG